MLSLKNLKDRKYLNYSKYLKAEEVQHETEIIDEMNAEKLNARRVTMVSPDDNIDWDDGNDEGQADDGE